MQAEIEYSDIFSVIYCNAYGVFSGVEHVGLDSDLLESGFPGVDAGNVYVVDPDFTAFAKTGSDPAISNLLCTAGKGLLKGRHPVSADEPDPFVRWRNLCVYRIPGTNPLCRLPVGFAGLSGLRQRGFGVGIIVDGGAVTLGRSHNRVRCAIPIQWWPAVWS